MTKRTIDQQKMLQKTGKFVFLRKEREATFVVISHQINQTLANLSLQLGSGMGLPLTATLSKKPIKVSKAQEDAMHQLDSLVNQHVILTINTGAELEDIIAFHPQNAQDLTNKTKSKEAVEQFINIMNTIGNVENKPDRWVWQMDSLEWNEDESINKVAKVIIAKETKILLSKQLPISAALPTNSSVKTSQHKL